MTCLHSLRRAGIKITFSECQKQIQEICQEFIDEEDIYGVDDEKAFNIINKYILKLESPLIEGFRPHYFFIPAMVSDLHSDAFSNVAVNANTAIEILKNIDKDYSQGESFQKYEGIQKFVSDDKFRYNVVMFFLALDYELKVAISIKSPRWFDSFRELIPNLIKKESVQIQTDLQNDIDKKAATFRRQIASIMGEVNTAQTDSKKMLKKLQKVNKDSDQLMSHILSILGIFVAMIFVFVGGYDTLSLGLTSNLFSETISQINIGGVILMGQILFNLIFLFLFMVARLSNKSIAVKCLGCNDGCSNKRCKFGVRLWKQYPYVVVTNFTMFFSYIILFIWWAIEKFAYPHFEKELVNFFASHWIIGMTLCIIIAILIIITAVSSFYAMIRKINKKYEQNVIEKQKEEENKSQQDTQKI